MKQAERGTQVLVSQCLSSVGGAGGPEQGLLKSGAEALPAQSKGNAGGQTINKTNKHNTWNSER